MGIGVMTIRSMARQIALTVPQIRRLYDNALAQGRLAREQSKSAARLRAKLEDSEQKNEVLRGEKDSIELQLYVLRSDHQRTIARNQELRVQNEELRGQLDGTRAQAEELRGQLEEARTQLEEAHTQLQMPNPMVVPVQTKDIDLLYAKLSARLTILSGDVATLLRVRWDQSCSATTVDVANRVLYLDLLEKSLTGQILQDTPIDPWSQGYDPEVRLVGHDWPSIAQTMIGVARMRNVRILAERVLEENVPGDFLEAGVWRGGACIYMRGILAAYGMSDRVVWAADSFAGLPPPNPEIYPADTGDAHHTVKDLSIPLEEVRANFALYGLLDDQVQFLKGWFEESLPGAPVERLAILRLDGDMYSSTIQTLDALYAKVSPGGFVIIDDYILHGCRQAVLDFRNRHGIDDEIQDIDGAGIYWRKGSREAEA
jgi:O-methyltransferase/8-demethyl-8-(2,3-dimethoxy-alpha-L-rhamnosyl)tetracenomycin-C 4'-O-methyltransferase